MSEDKEMDEGLKDAVDPPVHDGGEENAKSLDSPSEEAIDPPSHDGGS